MILEQAYASPSNTTVEGKGSRLNLVADQSRPQVFVNAQVKDSVSFAHAMLGLYQVVCSNLAVTRDHSAYQEWVQQRYLEELDVAVVAAIKRLPDLKRESKELARQLSEIQGRIDQLSIDLQASKASFRKDRQRFYHWLYGVNRQAWVIIDPVVSVQDDCVIFEGFSIDESTYGRVTLPSDQLEYRSPIQRGTTNVDFGIGLATEFERVRSYRPLSLHVGAESVQVSTTVGTAVEKKVDLPDTWVEGFLQVQSAVSLPGIELTLSAGTVADVIAYLDQRRERHGPRSLKFHLYSGRHVEIELEPWGIRIKEKKFIYRGDQDGEIRVWGRRRLGVLRDLLPDAEQVDVRLLGTGMPSFWSIQTGSARFDVGFSGWTANDWATRARFDQMASIHAPSERVITRAAALLKERCTLTPGQLAAETRVTRPESTAALQHLCAEGKAMYDVSIGCYRWRELFPPGVVASKRDKDNKLERAKVLVRDGAVYLQKQDMTADGQSEFQAAVTDDRAKTASSMDVSLSTDADGRVVYAECTCSDFKHNKLRQGPCQHILAVVLSTVTDKATRNHG